MWVRLPAGAKYSRFSKTSTPALRLTQPPTKSVLVDCFLGVKRPGREADHIPRLRMSVPVPLLHLHVFKQELHAQLHLSTYFLLTITVLFSWYSPITNLQKFELTGRRANNTRSWRYSTAFLTKVGNGVQLPHKKVPKKQFSSHFAAGACNTFVFLRLTSEIKKKRSRALILWTRFCHPPFCTLWQIFSGHDTGETPTSDADMCHFSSKIRRIYFVSFS